MPVLLLKANCLSSVDMVDIIQVINYARTMINFIHTTLTHLPGLLQKRKEIFQNPDAPTVYLVLMVYCTYWGV